MVNMQTEDLIAKNLPEIAATLRDSQVVILPTDTIDGLHCLANSQKAINKLYKIKQRSPEKPCILLCADLQMAMRYCEFDDLARQLANHFWAGQLTIVLPRLKHVLPDYLPKIKTLAIRIPDNELLRKLINLNNIPLLSTSANISRESPKTDKLPSTIVQVVDNQVKLVRVGVIDFKTIQATI